MNGYTSGFSVALSIKEPSDPSGRPSSVRSLKTRFIDMLNALTIMKAEICLFLRPNKVKSVYSSLSEESFKWLLFKFRTAVNFLFFIFLNKDSLL